MNFYDLMCIETHVFDGFGLI